MPFKSVTESFNSLAAQLQPDPLDPSKWQVVTTPAPGGALPITVGQLGATATPDQTGELGQKRVRRVACTCPNCRDGDGRYGGM